MGQIEEALDALPVRVLYAAETGDRAYGVADPEDEPEVSVLYVHPLDWYLAVEEPEFNFRECTPEDLRMRSSEIKSTFRSLLGRTATLHLEFLLSPLPYRQDESFISELRAIAMAGWSPHYTLHHYLGRGRKAIRRFAEVEKPTREDTMWVLRPLMACRWLREEDSFPPVPFEALVARETDAALLDLLDRVKAATSPESVPRGEVEKFVSNELAHLESARELPDRDMDSAALNDLFRRTVLAS